MLDLAHSPDWDRLFETAAGQHGLFTTRQARDAGYSPQLLVHYVRTNRALRLLRGVYRLVHFPATDHEELVAVWLWSEHAGVCSHLTALNLHQLSDALPAHIDFTLPAAWRQRRLRVPAEVRLHYSDVTPAERTWFGAVPTTNAARTLNDCALDGLSPEPLREAAQQALHRGLVTRDELAEVTRALKPFGGLT